MPKEDMAEREQKNKERDNASSSKNIIYYYTLPRSQKKPPLIWVRILSSLAFFLGGAFMMFWAQGLRVNSEGEIFKTGVIVVSTIPSDVQVFIDKKWRGASDDYFLGIPLGKSEVCLQKGNYFSLCETLSVDSEIASELNNVYLPPQKIQKEKIHASSKIYFDPYGRGYIQTFPEFSSLLIYNKEGEISFLEFEDGFPGIIFLDSYGRLVTDFSLPRNIFGEIPIHEQKKNMKNIVFHQKKHLSIKKEGEKPQKLYTFPSVINSLFFFEDSDSFLCITEEKIHLFPTPFSSPHSLVSLSKNSLIDIVKNEKEILLFIYENGEVVKYIWKIK